MGLSAKALREKLPPLSAEIKRLADLANDENRDFSAEENEKWELINKDYNLTLASAERQERVESVTATLEAPVERQEERRQPGREDTSGERETKEERVTGPTDEDRSLALQAWCVRQLDEGCSLQERQLEAARRCGVNPNAREYHVDLRGGNYRKLQGEYRALSALNDTAGGYTVPEGFVNNLEMAMLAFGGMRQVADVMRTSSGEELHWPTTNDTGNTGAIIAESAAVSEQDVTFGEVIFRAYKYTSKLVRVPVELMQDSAFDLASVLGQMLGERIGRITNTHFTTGTGAAQPKGIVTAAAAGVTATSATAITADDIFGLVHSLDPAYRSGPGVGFMMHDTILLAVRKLKDGNGQYLWQPGLQAREPDTILGYPVTINQDMASSIASAAITMLFGLFSKYKIRDVAGLRLRRLVERYADQDQEGFVAFSRHDGNLLDAGGSPVRKMTH